MKDLDDIIALLNDIILVSRVQDAKLDPMRPGEGFVTFHIKLVRDRLQEMNAGSGNQETKTC
jgi:hypothetical protein